MEILLLIVSFCMLNQAQATLDVDFITKYQENYRMPDFFAKDTGFNSSLKIHFDGVQKIYTTELNQVLSDWRRDENNTLMQKASLLQIAQQIESIEGEWRKRLQRSVGGFVNHLFYFSTLLSSKLDVNDNEENVLPEEMSHVLSRSFINISQFKETFETEVHNFYGAGFVWLCRVPGKKYLSIFPTLEDTTSLSSGFQPLVGIDLWEHAYYTKFLNNRKSYFKNWWREIDWIKVNEIYKWWISLDLQ